MALLSQLSITRRSSTILQIHRSSVAYRRGGSEGKGHFFVAFKE